MLRPFIVKVSVLGYLLLSPMLSNAVCYCICYRVDTVHPQLSA